MSETVWTTETGGFIYKIPFFRRNSGSGDDTVRPHARTQHTWAIFARFFFGHANFSRNVDAEKRPYIDVVYVGETSADEGN